MIGMFMAVFALMLFIAILSPMNTMINIAKQSDNLNCAGYSVSGNPNNTLSYNSTLNTNELACVILNLYIPYIALGLLFYLGARIMTRSPEQPYY